MFDSEYDISYLKLMSETCNLCNLFSKSLASTGTNPLDITTLRRDGVTVSVKDGPKLLSIYTDPGMFYTPDSIFTLIY